MIKVKVVRTGRVKPPNLADPQLRAIGDIMVAQQKKRWNDGINADGIQAKKLSFRYYNVKRKYTHQASPIRDMKMTGETLANFQLRKAANGMIRAENTTRETRKRATTASNTEQMIGFAASDQIAVFTESEKQFGSFLKKAWVPLG